MPRRGNDNLSESSEPPKKRNCNNAVVSSIDLKCGTLLKDISGKQWKLGKPVGVGGFGEIYLASDNLTEEIKTDCNYVAKVETHRNGPLFVEMNCYLRIAKLAMIEEWKSKKKMGSLGMPHYVASGSHVHRGEKYRFLILPKFDGDLEKVLQEKKMFNIKTVLTISLQIIDVLEYIHSKGYIHSDIKASNILLCNKKTLAKPVVLKTELKKHFVSNHQRACKKPNTRSVRNLRPVPQVRYVDDIPNFTDIFTEKGDIKGKACKKSEKKDQVYLLDYGLACKYLTSSGTHKPFCADERKAHAGTILFCSRDAHKGVQSRRSDLESLGYNIIHWLTGNLPWCNDVEEPVIVEKKKIKAMMDIEYYLKTCFNEYPKFVEDYFKYLQNLQFQEKPDYDYCKRLFKQGLNTNRYKDDSLFDFENVQKSKTKQIKKRNSENMKIHKLVYKISRLPLQSNIPVKPLLRKKVKNKKLPNKTKWFEDLTDPEEILKQAREKKNSESHESNLVSRIADLDIRQLNPTYAMIEVYNKCVERVDVLPSCKGDSSVDHVEGYTQAMMSVLQKLRKRRELESEAMAVNLRETRSSKFTKRCVSNRRKKNESQPKLVSQTRATKSNIALKKPVLHGRKVKSGVQRRSYSLRG